MAFVIDIDIENKHGNDKMLCVVQKAERRETNGKNGICQIQQYWANIDNILCDIL